VVVDFNESPAFVVTAFVQDLPPEAHRMTVTIAGITFDSHEYDDRGDFLYLSVGPPREVVAAEVEPALVAA
jgi:hypothetical protein